MLKSIVVAIIRWILDRLYPGFKEAIYRRRVLCVDIPLITLYWCFMLQLFSGWWFALPDIFKVPWEMICFCLFLVGSYVESKEKVHRPKGDIRPRVIGPIYVWGWVLTTIICYVLQVVRPEMVQVPESLAITAGLILLASFRGISLKQRFLHELESQNKLAVEIT
ncbi:MAG: hypothetical protein ABIE68_04815 [bacterium]